MAGVKGRSGGARANSGGPRPNSGGARPGAGRKPKAKQLLDETALPQTDDPVAFLTAVMNSAALDIKDRKDAAKALLSMKSNSVAGKKERKQAAAEKVAGRFTTAAPPRLAVVK